MNVACIEPANDARWQALLDAHPAGLFHSPPWFRALTDAYGFDVRAYVVCDSAGTSLAGLPFCEITDALGPRLVSLPFSDACDPLVSSRACWEALFARLRTHGVPVHLRCLKDPTAPADERLTTIKRARWHTLSIDIPPEAQWAGMAGCTRRGIRKAERSGVEIRPLESSEGLREFYGLHVALRKRKYRLLAQPLVFFEAIARRFGEADGWFPLGAYLGDRLVAATIYLRWGETLFYKFNASDVDALNTRPNNLLVWEGISLARSLGCRRVDLGPSDDDQPGLIRFKRHFGAAEKELRFLRYTPPEWQDERGADAKRLLGALTDLFTIPDVPDDVAARAGALLYRYFS